MNKYRTPCDGNPVGESACQTEADGLFKQLDALLRQERYFLNPGIKRERICFLVKTNPLSLLQALKKYGFRNFSHFINYYRVEEAKRMMISQEYDIYTLEAIANMAGFGTRQSFYDAFERLSGVKPACYRRLAKGQVAEGPAGGSYKPGR
jgi:AraC-like DNA-binding protein